MKFTVLILAIGLITAQAHAGGYRERCVSNVNGKMDSLQLKEKLRELDAQLTNRVEICAQSYSLVYKVCAGELEDGQSLDFWNRYLTQVNTMISLTELNQKFSWDLVRTSICTQEYVEHH